MQEKYRLALHLLFAIVLQMRPLAQELHIDQLGARTEKKNRNLRVYLHEKDNLMSATHLFPLTVVQEAWTVSLMLSIQLKPRR